MTEIPKVRLILADSMAREEFRVIARGHDWIPHQVYDAPGLNYEEVWTKADQTAALHYVEDSEISGERFLLVRSDSVHAYAPAIARAFRAVSPDELYKTIVYGENVDERIRALTRLGVVAFDVTKDVRVAWETGLFHVDERMRLATIRAMSFNGLPALIPLLKEAALEDPSDDVRTLAQQLIDSIQRHHPMEAVPRSFPLGNGGR
jgi:hypothetical protein